MYHNNIRKKNKNCTQFLRLNPVYFNPDRHIDVVLYHVTFVATRELNKLLLTRPALESRYYRRPGQEAVDRLWHGLRAQDL